MLPRAVPGIWVLLQTGPMLLPFWRSRLGLLHVKDRMQLEAVGRRPAWLVRSLAPVPKPDPDKDGDGLARHSLERCRGLSVEVHELLPDGLECADPGGVLGPGAGGIDYLRDESTLPVDGARDDHVEVAVLLALVLNQPHPDPVDG